MRVGHVPTVHGQGIMALLLDRRGGDALITKGVVKAAGFRGFLDKSALENGVTNR